MDLYTRLTEVSYTTVNVLDALPSVLIFLACSVGASLFLNFLLSWAEYGLLYRFKSRNYIEIGPEKYQQSSLSARSWSNLFRSIIYSILFFGIGLILWTSAAFMGANILTMSATGLILGVVITYTFADVLRLIGAGYFHCFIANVDLGEYIEFEGQGGYDGFLVDMFFTYALMARYDPEYQSVQLICVPITDFLNKRFKRFPRKTFEARLPVLNEDEVEEKKYLLEHRKPGPLALPAAVPQAPKPLPASSSRRSKYEPAKVKEV